MNTAQRAKAMGLIVGDTIRGIERASGGGWHEALLTLLWIGNELAVWRERSRSSTHAIWEDGGEVSDWVLDCRPWVVVNLAEAIATPPGDG